MGLLHWTPLGINFLILVIMIASITGYLSYRAIRAAQQGPSRRDLILLLTIYLAGFGAMVCQFLSYVLHPDYVNYVLPWVSVFGAGAMAAFVRFGFEFQRENWRGTWGSRLLDMVNICFVTLESWVAIQRVILLGTGHVEYREAWFDFPFTFGFALAYAFYTERYLTAIAEAHQSRRAAIVPAIRGLFHSAQTLEPRAAAARAYIYVSLLPVAHAVLLLMRSYGWMDWAVVEALAMVIALLTFAGFALAHLNHAPAATTFQIKLVGSALVAVLAIVSGLSWLIGPVYIDAYRNPNHVQNATTLRFAPMPDGSYQVARTGHFYDETLGTQIDTNSAIELPFDFPFFDQSYRQIFPHRDGMVGFQEWPLWRDVQHRFGPQPAIFARPLASRPAPETGGVFLSLAPNRVTLTFHDQIPVYGGGDVYRTQLRLYPTGVIEMAMDATPDTIPESTLRAHGAPMMLGIVPGLVNRRVHSVRLAQDLPLTSAPNTGVVEIYRYDFLIYLDNIYRPMAFFVLVSSILILLIFPRFYRANISQPLRAMIGGVEDIMRGKLDTTIPVKYRDEFGYLADAFNQMTTAQRDLVETLEDKVAERSETAARLAAKNARLEERHHLARELHDAVSQTLFAANLEAQHLSDLTGRNPAQAAASARRVQDLNREALAEMRLLLAELRPERLLNRPFGDLLRNLARDMGEKHGLTINLSVENDLNLPENVQLAFFRVAQEALNNAVKHSKATELQILFDGLETQALLSVQDFGTGFDPDFLDATRFGLRSMSERLTAIGGTLEIETAPGQGTQITAIWYDSDDRND